jgi:hypothetical protein
LTKQAEIDGVRRATTDADNDDKTRSHFACPFQRLNPFKHHNCWKYELKRIKDVKQHVYRHHRQPEYYCARCFKTFKTANVRDEHARSKDCDILESLRFEGITEAQKKTLNKSSSRGLHPQEQWFEMWDIIFPDEKRPSSAWMGSYLEESVQLLRRLWITKKSNILAKALRGQAKPLDRVVLDNVMESIFECLEAEAEAEAALKKRGRG